MMYSTQPVAPGPPINHQIFDDARFQGSPPEHTFARDLGVDPFSSAPAFDGATLAPQHEVGMMDGGGAMEYLTADSHFQVWKLPRRGAMRGGGHS